MRRWFCVRSCISLICIPGKVQGLWVCTCRCTFSTICWGNLLFLMRWSRSWSVFDLLINKVNPSSVKVTSFSLSESILLIRMNPEKPRKSLLLILLLKDCLFPCVFLRCFLKLQFLKFPFGFYSYLGQEFFSLRQRPSGRIRYLLVKPDDKCPHRIPK